VLGAAFIDWEETSTANPDRVGLATVAGIATVAKSADLQKGGDLRGYGRANGTTPDCTEAIWIWSKSTDGD
jgi:hypothetical protein